MNAEAPSTAVPGLSVRSDPSLANLLTKLASESGTLVRQEVTLATRELGDKAKSTSVQVSIVAIGALIGTVSLMSFAEALILGLASFLAMWVSALAVAVVLGLVAYAFVRKGLRALRAVNARPAATMQTLEEGKSWVHSLVR